MYRLCCGVSNPLHLSQSLPSATWPFRTFTFISTFFHFLLSRVSLLFLTFHVLLPLRHLTLSYFYFHFYFFTLSYFYFNFYIFTLSYFYFHFYFLQSLLLLLLQRFTLLLGFFNSFFWHFTFTVLLFTCTFFVSLLFHPFTTWPLYLRFLLFPLLTFRCSYFTFPFLFLLLLRRNASHPPLDFSLALTLTIPFGDGRFRPKFSPKKTRNTSLRTQTY